MRSLVLHPLFALAVAVGVSAQPRVSASAPGPARDSLRAAARPVAARPAPRPDRRYSPEEVVGFQLAALRNNDVPVRDAGIATAFAFASPSNRAVMGPLDRFVELVKSPSYRPLVHHLRAERGPMRVYGSEAEQRVTVVGPMGERVLYLFTLTRQPEGSAYAGCWMTDGVMRLRSFEPAPAMVRTLAMLDGRGR